jgi:staphylococcal nuclease domain-containing protein 1
MHKGVDSKSGAINDLTDPRKAKAYSGSLMRAGKIKGTVDFVFNGALFKIHVPSENCYIRFSPSCIRCPQPSPSAGSKQQSRAAEPFGDEAKRYARLHALQRQVELECNGVTNSGIITGNMIIGFGKNRVDYAIELLGAGLATVDQRKIDYGEAPRQLIDAQAAAEQNKVGVWSIAKPGAVAKQPVKAEKSAETVATIRLSEIRAGNHFFFRVTTDEAGKVMDDSMKLFTTNNGTVGAPCDVKVNKVVAALFDDGVKSWYRAKILEKKGTNATVLFIDHGNVATVTPHQMRPLDMSLSVERIPAVAREAVLALVGTRPLSTDEGVEAARLLQSLTWDKDVKARLLAPDESGRLAVVLEVEDGTVNELLIEKGLARVAKPEAVEVLASRMVDSSSVVQLAADLNVAQEKARKSRVGIWRYGDIGDDDPDEI